MRRDASLRNSLVISACLHVAGLLILYFGLPTLFKPLPPLSRPVPFEIVDIAAITNTRVKDKPEEAEKPPPAPPKPTPPVKAETPPPQPPAKTEAKPEPPKPDTPAEALLPKPLAKPKPPEPPKKPSEDPLSSVLKNVAKLKPSPPKSETPAEESPTKSTEAKSAAPSLSDRLTISEEDLLRRQISQCWNMPVGARNAEELIVEVLISVNPDRTVREAEVVDQTRMGTDSFFRAAAEAALRALRNPRCSPLELPPEKYEQWKSIRFNFDPRDML